MREKREGNRHEATKNNQIERVKSGFGFLMALQRKWGKSHLSSMTVSGQSSVVYSYDNAAGISGDSIGH